jgi:hypothetical protein
MSKRGFWLGLLVGAVITGLLVATAMFVMMRFRWPAAAGIYGLRGRQFGVNPRGWFLPRMPGRGFGFGAMLCGPLLLLAGALVLGALLGKHWHSRRQAREVQSRGQTPAVESSVKADEPPAEPVASQVVPQPPAEAGSGEIKR